MYVKMNVHYAIMMCTCTCILMQRTLLKSMLYLEIVYMFCVLLFYCREVKFLVYMLIVTHITACIWFLLACASLSVGSDVHTCDVGSWALKEPFDKPLSMLTFSLKYCHIIICFNLLLVWCTISVLFYFVGNFSLGYQYIVSVYWASATTVSVGYGDIHAHTDLEVLIQTMPYFSTCLHVFVHFVDML